MNGKIHYIYLYNPLSINSPSLEILSHLLGSSLTDMVIQTLPIISNSGVTEQCGALSQSIGLGPPFYFVKRVYAE